VADLAPEDGGDSESSMAVEQKSNRRKVRKPRFYKRKGLWLALIVLAMVNGRRGWVVWKRRPANTAAGGAYDLEASTSWKSPA
jgi:predicted negative regulator of RcsB-dependent stress response